MDIDSVRTPRRPQPSQPLVHPAIPKASYGVRLSNAIPQERQDFEKRLMMQAVDLISKGKVNAKNAFDLPTEFTDVIPAFVRKSAENGWIEVSQGLDASAKIYGYRVDALHSDTYKIRGGLYRNMKENEKEEEEGKGGELSKRRAKESTEGERTLDTESNLTTEKFELEFSCDPLFRKATAKFDERGAKGLTQNVSKLSNKGLEVLFYTGKNEANAEEGREVLKEIQENPLASVVLSQYKSQVVSFASDIFRNFSFEDLSSRKINDYIVDYKHEKLEIPYPVLDLTPFAVAQNAFTQSLSRIDAPEVVTEPIAADMNGIEDDQWLSKLNNDKTDEELSMFGMTGTQETAQSFDDTALTADEYRMLGIDLNAKGTQEKFLGAIALGDGDALGMSRIFKEEGSDWHQFQQLKLPNKVAGQTMQPAAPKRKKKEDEVLVFDAKAEMSLDDLLKHTHKPTASARKKAAQGVTLEEFSQLLIEKNYHFPLNRLTKLSLRPMLLKLKLDTKQMNFKGKMPGQNDGTGIVIDTQIGNDENNYVADGPDAEIEQANAYKELEAAKEAEIELKLDTFSKVINAKQLKEKLWKHIEQNKAKEEEEKEIGVLYRAEFSSLFAGIQTNQSCSPQACFVCLLHLANEKGLTITQPVGDIADFNVLKQQQ